MLTRMKSFRIFCLPAIAVITGLFLPLTGSVRSGLADSRPQPDHRWMDVDGDGRVDSDQIAGDENHDGVFDDRPILHNSDRAEAARNPREERLVSPLALNFELVWDSSNLLNNVWQMAVYDFDGDGKMGIASMIFTPQKQLYLFENISDNDFDLTWESPSPSPPGAFVTVTGGDSDGDGEGEIIGGEASTLNQVLLYEAAADDSFEARDIEISEPDFSGELSMDRVLVTDTDGDGFGEIIFDIGGTSGGKVFIYEQDGQVGENTYTKVYEYETVSYLVDLAVGDSDNDGNQEIILGVGGWPGFPLNLRRLEYNPVTGTYEHKMVQPGVTGLPLSPSVDDIDGDGLNEIVMGSTASDGGGTVYIFEATDDDEYISVFESPFEFDGTVLTTGVGPVIGNPCPGIVAGSYGGELNLYGFDGEMYRVLLSNPITSSGSIRGSYLGYTDDDDNPDIVFSSLGDDRVYVYEQVPPPVIMVDLEPYESVIPRGGLLEFSAGVVNTTADSQEVEGLTSVFLPGGVPFPDNPLLGPVPITLAPYEMIQLDLHHTVPAIAPPGIYTYFGVIGLPPRTLIDIDSFEFEVIEED